MFFYYKTKREQAVHRSRTDSKIGEKSVIYIKSKILFYRKTIVSVNLFFHKRYAKKIVHYIIFSVKLVEKKTKATSLSE